MTEPEPKRIVSPDNAEDETRKPDAVDETTAGFGQSQGNNRSVPTVPMPAKFGRYRILRQLGRGAMGTVYLAVDSQLDRQVALKVPQFDAQQDTEGLERFFREARVMASLRHPNLCPVYDAGEIAGTYYLTMAYIQGQPLSDLIRPLWQQRQVAALFEKLARALHEAHKAGVIHRDLKPSNIMIEQGEPIIMDFGLARRDMAEDLTLTRTGTIVGTPAYMSPEQVSGEKNIGPATDIYSLGVILYQMLTGELPFQGSLVTVLGKIVMSAPPPLKGLRGDVDESLERICLAALAKRPSDRFADGTRMAQSLAAYLRGETDLLSELPATQRLDTASPPLAIESPAVKPATPVPPSAVRSRSNRTRTLAALITATVLLAIGGWRVIVATRIPSIDNIPDVASSNDNSITSTPVTAAVPSPTVPSPTLSEPTPREAALAALGDKKYSAALRMFDKITQDPGATEDDFANQARALLGLAESGDATEVNFSRAVEAFGRAKRFADQARTRHAAARDLAQRADKLAEQLPAEDKRLAAEDQRAIAEYQTAIDAAEQHELKESVEWQVELATFESRPRFQVRAAMVKIRAQIQTHYSAAKALAQQANALEKDRPSEDPRLEALDEQAIAEFRSALTLARQNPIEATALERVQAELLSLENCSRVKEREVRKKRREEAQVMAARARLVLSQDPKQAVAIFSNALELSPPNAPERWSLFRDRGTARAQLARATANGGGLQAAWEDITMAIKVYPQSPELLEDTKAPSAPRQEFTVLLAAKASLAEEIDEGQASEVRLQDAAGAFDQAARLDHQTYQYPLGIARTTLKLIQRSVPLAPLGDPRLVAVERSLAAVLTLNANCPEAHNLQGELHLLRGDVSSARTAFDRAVAGNEPIASRRQRYYSNLSRSCLGAPADAKRALAAADQAIALGEATAAMHFCRGQALRLLKQLPLEAVREFDHVLRVQPQNVEALLARSQLVVETPEVGATKYDQATQDIATALRLASTGPLKAEAYYVQSLARLRDLVQLIGNGSPPTPVEEAMVKCQRSAWEAVRLESQNPVYKKHAQEIFDNAAKFSWQDATLQQESTRLRRQFEDLGSAGTK